MGEWLVTGDSGSATFAGPFARETLLRVDLIDSDSVCYVYVASHLATIEKRREFFTGNL